MKVHAGLDFHMILIFVCPGGGGKAKPTAFSVNEVLEGVGAAVKLISVFGRSLDGEVYHRVRSSLRGVSDFCYVFFKRRRQPKR